MTDVLTPRANTPGTGLATEQEAREVAEGAREKEWEAPSFVREMFEGSYRLELVHPFPRMEASEIEEARPFMERLERFLREKVDSDLIDREGKIPAEVIDGLREIGAFGIKIPKEYGGLGLSQTAYTHAIGMVTSVDGKPHRPPLGGAVDRRAGAAQALRHTGPEEEVSAPPREGRDLGVRAHRESRRQRPGRPGDQRGALPRRDALDPERREALVHQRAPSPS